MIKETINYPNGDIYKGEIKDGKKHGQGTLTTDYVGIGRSKYVGAWKNDKKHGLGTYTYANGDTKTCNYKNDKKIISD